MEDLPPWSGRPPAFIHSLYYEQSSQFRFMAETFFWLPPGAKSFSDIYKSELCWASYCLEGRIRPAETIRATSRVDAEVREWDRAVS